MERTHLAICMVTLLIFTAGCLGFLTGDEPLEGESDPVSISDTALEETGYEHSGDEEIAINESVTINGETREVQLTNWKSSYTPTEGMVGETNSARFVAYTTPAVEVAGTSLNPVAQLNNTDVLTFILEQQEGMDSLEKVNETEVSTLGTDATVNEFEGTVTIEGQEATVTVHLTQVKHDGDYIIAFGVYPQDFDEEEDILTLIENLEHGSE